jgi:hypothetical protein
MVSVCSHACGHGIGEHMRSSKKTPKSLALLDRVMILIYNVYGKEENSLHNYEVALVYEILISSVWTAYTSHSHQVSHAYLSFI